MKNSIKPSLRIFSVIAIVCLSFLSEAQPPPPPGGSLGGGSGTGGSNNQRNGGGAAIDGGLFILLGMGGIYASKKIYSFSVKSDKN